MVRTGWFDKLIGYFFGADTMRERTMRERTIDCYGCEGENMMVVREDLEGSCLRCGSAYLPGYDEDVDFNKDD